MNQDLHEEKWARNAPRGLLLTGFGLSLLGEAIVTKYEGKAFWRWFILGTLALVVFNAGLAVFGDSIKDRALFEMKNALELTKQS